MPTSNHYPIPAATHRTEEEINRSRFVTTLGYTPTVEAARLYRHSQHRNGDHLL